MTPLATYESLASLIDHPLVKPFAKILGVIPIASDQGPREMIHSLREATEALRGLVDSIVLIPEPDGEALQIELRGNLAAMLGTTYKRRGRPTPTSSPCRYLWLRGRATNSLFRNGLQILVNGSRTAAIASDAGA